MAGGELFHFSQEPGIAVFEPRAPAHRPEVEALVWAVDSTHQWTYLFPRDCPRILAWPVATTTAEDRRHWLGDGEGRGVACIEWEWLERMRSTRLYRCTYCRRRPSSLRRGKTRPGCSSAASA